MRNSTLYQLAGPVTFRRGSRKILGESNKKNVGWGSNLQNIEKSMRQMYISDGLKETQELTSKCKYWLATGDTSVFTEEELMTLRVFVQIDQAGAEALIMAYDSEKGAYRELFENDIKVHVYVALKLFKDVWPKKMREKGGIDLDIETLYNTPIANLRLNPQWKELDLLIKDSDNWSLSERYYYLAKQTCHSSNYGVEWYAFLMNILDKSGGKIVISRKEAESFLQIYRGLFPEIPARNERVRRQVDKYGVIYNMFGHPYQITKENISEREYKELYAWGPQSTVGEITRTAVCDFQEYVEDENKQWDFLQDNHDSFLTQGPLLDVHDRIKKMQEFINIEFISPVDGTKFRMKSEAQIGFNWGVYDKNKPEKNPLGLREIKWN